MSEKGPAKSETARMLDFHKEADLLNSFLMCDLISATNKGQLNFQMNEIAKTYNEKFMFLLNHHGLQKHSETYKNQILKTFQNYLAVALMSTDIPQIKIENYDKWKTNQSEGKYHFGYYSCYVFDTLSSYLKGVKEQQEKPNLMMNTLEEQLELMRKYSPEDSQKTRRPRSGF